MSGNRNPEEALFDDLVAEEERLAAEEQAEFDAIEPDAVEQPAEDPVEAMHRIIAEQQAENEELKDKMLRTVAEMENLRRRTTREVTDAKTYAVANFARDMLSVSDNLRRTTDAVTDEAKAEGNAGLTALIEGVEMLNALEKHGVNKLNPKGEKFDPNFHQAMYEIPNPDLPNNMIIDVAQEGFTIGTRVLRPAMVGVAKGGPKFSEIQASEETSPEIAEDTESET